jgi:CheY-like chemotaxis protein
MGHISDLLDQALAVCSSLVVDLSPPILYDLGLGAALEWLGRQMQSKYGLKVRVVIEPDSDSKADSTGVLLYLSVRELLVNVLKHARAQSAGVRMCRTSDGKMRITVKDNGIGFDCRQSRSSEGTSAGLGLFSIRERLALMGGELLVDSATGRGTRMTLIVPMEAAANTVSQGFEAVPAGAGGESEAQSQPHQDDIAIHKIRVLLADDHEIVRHGLVELLTQCAPEIEVVGEAGDGRMAVELTGIVHPDVVIMDVSMPELNGVQATRRIVSEHPNIKVIGLSMYPEGDRADAMSKAGAVAYLHKAGAPEDLIAAIRACVPPV